MDISLCLDPARPWRELLALACGAEERGTHAIYVPDHFGAYREAWTLVSALAVATDRARVGTLVLGATHRHLSVLREMARTLHEVCGGRLVLGLGAAWDEAEHHELGLPFPPVSQRLDLLESACRLMADADHALLVAGGGQRRTMPIAAAHASHWHTWAEPDAFGAKCAIMDSLCREAGREPSAVRRVTGEMLLGHSDPEGLVDAYARVGVDEFVARDHHQYKVSESLAALPPTR